MSEYATAIAGRRTCKHKYTRQSTLVYYHIGAGLGKAEICSFGAYPAALAEECLDANDVIEVAEGEQLQKAQDWKKGFEEVYQKIVEEIDNYLKPMNDQLSPPHEFNELEEENGCVQTENPMKKQEVSSTEMQKQIIELSAQLAIAKSSQRTADNPMALTSYDEFSTSHFGTENRQPKY